MKNQDAIITTTEPVAPDMTDAERYADYKMAMEELDTSSKDSSSD